MKYNRNKRKFIKNLFVFTTIFLFPFSTFFPKKNHRKMFLLKKKFSKVWLLDINDS